MGKDIEKTIAKLQDNVEKEMQLFKNYLLEKGKEVIFDRHYEINFKCEYYEFLRNATDYIDEEVIEWLSTKKHPLDCLYDLWMKCADDFNGNYEVMADWLLECYKKECNI